MALLFPIPPTFELPISKGGDVYFGVKYKPLVVDGSGDPILDADGKKQYAEANYPSGATLAVVIETSPTPADNVLIDATITGSLAIVWGDDIPNIDAVKAGNLWRAIITYVTGLDKVLANGKVVRADG